MIETLNAILAGTKGKKFIMFGDGHIDYILKNLASVLDLSGVKKACDDFLAGRPEQIVENIFGIGKVVKA